MKRCPFCHKFVWFWQSKCYLDARGKEPCHTVCFLWEMARARKETHVEEEDWAEDLWASSEPTSSVVLIASKGDEVKKVEDDSWRKDVEK